MAGRPRRRAQMPKVARSERVWKPFEPGNTAAMRSGAYSPRVVDPYAVDLGEWLTGQEALPFLAETSFGPSVLRWAQRQAQADLLFEHLSRHQREAECAGCRSCVSLQDRWRVMDQSAERAGESLGLDPRSRAEILLRLRAANVIESEAEEARSMLGGLLQDIQGAWALAQATRELEESTRPDEPR